jgi:enolase-phosphatase E1
MKAILLDIEGTTTPVNFVHEVLFPYSRERVNSFVAMHFGELRSEIEQLVDESSHDDKYTVPVDPLEPGSVAAYLEHLIDKDRKSTPLKSIQGKMWQEGYRSGELLAQIFDDVPPALERWAAADKEIAIYSSGSALAQRLLFRHTDKGDLTSFISDYFDTNVGAKREPESYETIAARMGYLPREITFISDVPEELDAAASIGMGCVLVDRPGHPERGPELKYKRVTSFSELD